MTAAIMIALFCRGTPDVMACRKSIRKCVATAKDKEQKEYLQREKIARESYRRCVEDPERIKFRKENHIEFWQDCSPGLPFFNLPEETKVENCAEKLKII